MSDETTDFRPKFDEHGFIAAIAQDAVTKDVLMIAWMNEEALEQTLKTGEAHYWSRSRKELWHKGATSGAIQRVKDIRIDCDQDAVLLVVQQQKEGACHTGRPTCFYRKIMDDVGTDKHVLVFEGQKTSFFKQILPKFFDYFRQS
jgi:phosphoribosyl-AMP cyclohydrolase